MISRRKQPEPAPIPEKYVVMELSPEAFKAIEGISRMPSVPPRIRELLQEALRYSREVELPLARLPFEWLELEAKRQGCDPLDVLFDRAHAKEPDGL